MAWQAPNRFDVVESVNNDYPGLIYEDDLEFCRRVVCRCNKIPGEEGKWGLNAKRGNYNDISRDVMTFENPEVPWGCSIVDIIGNHPTPESAPAWIDQTKATYDAGTVGGFIEVSCDGTDPNPEPEPPVDPVEPPVDPEPPEHPIVDTALILKRLDELEIQSRNQFEFLVSHITTQSQATVDAVTAEANRVIASFPDFRCRFRLGGLFAENEESGSITIDPTTDKPTEPSSNG